MQIDQDTPLKSVINQHVIRNLKSYGGNLSYAVEVSKNNFLPSAEDERLQLLAEYLSEKGHDVIENFLLRVGLTVPGSQRGISPPLMVLDEDRGGFSSQRIKEAEGHVLKLNKALSIGRYFIPTLDSNSQQAIEDLALLVDGSTDLTSENLLHLTSELSTSDIFELTSMAISYIDSRDEVISVIGIDILTHLTCFREHPLSEDVCNSLIERGIFCPAILYRDGSEHVAKRIASLIEMPDVDLEITYLLNALAWTRSSMAVSAFAIWEETRPDWTEQLYVAPRDFLQGAGWCLDSNNERRDLLSTTSIQILPAEPDEPKSFLCYSPNDLPCPSCGGPSSWLFDFNQFNESHFQKLFAKAPRKILTCLPCAYYQPVFTKYSSHSYSLLKVEAEPYDSDEGWIPDVCSRKLSPSTCPPFASAEAFMLDDASTLGGSPMWMQDSEQPDCVECGQTMIFFAQFDNGSLGEEGIFYSFFCPDCSLSAVTYQQT